MATMTVTTTLTNGHLNGKIENGMNGYRKNGYINHDQPESVVSTIYRSNVILKITKNMH